MDIINISKHPTRATSGLVDSLPEDVRSAIHHLKQLANSPYPANDARSRVRDKTGAEADDEGDDDDEDAGNPFISRPTASSLGLGDAAIAEAKLLAGEESNFV